MKMRLSVVVPTYNVSHCIGSTLSAVQAALADVGGELIVVDNGSTDGTRELLRSQWNGPAKLADLPAKTISAVRNLGARMAAGEILFFLDADCLIARGFLGRAVRVLEETGADALSFHDEPPPSARWIETTWYQLHRPPSSGYITTLFGGNCMIRREAFERAGGFDESLATGEDSELGKRMAANGARIYLPSELTVVHLGNSKTLSAFFRRQMWHGVGMWTGWRTGGGIVTPAVTLAHLLLMAAGVVLLIAGPGAVVMRLAAALVLVLAMPAAAVAYRFLQRREASRPLRSLLLYASYLMARGCALFLLPVARRSGREMPRTLWWRR